MVVDFEVSELISISSFVCSHESLSLSDRTLEETGRKQNTKWSELMSSPRSQFFRRSYSSSL